MATLSTDVDSHWSLINTSLQYAHASFLCFFYKEALSCVRYKITLREWLQSAWEPGLLRGMKDAFSGILECSGSSIKFMIS